jgi:outer membrane protein assembly factor BamB
MAGPGPRATPTLADGALFSLGANGLLQRLDRLTGEVTWQRELVTEDDLKVPMWGFSSSPLVVDGKVIVSAVEPGERGVLAFDVADGKPAWAVPAAGMSYSSPQLVEIGDKRLAAVVSGTGVTFYTISSGAVALDYKWEITGYRTVQPMMVEGGMVIGSTRGAGSRRISLNAKGAELSAETRWTSLHLKPDFNDFVVHNGAIYGFDQSIFTCVDLDTGKRRWKGGRYGKGQVLLLPRRDQLLVLSEKGNLVLMSATPDKHLELARFPVIEGKTWNHPIMIGNRVYIRNGREAACVELPTVSEVDPEKIVFAN